MFHKVGAGLAPALFKYRLNHTPALLMVLTPLILKIYFTPTVKFHQYFDI